MSEEPRQNFLAGFLFIYLQRGIFYIYPMKKFFFILPLVVFSFFFYLLDNGINDTYSQDDKISNQDPCVSKKPSTDYKINVKLLPQQKTLIAEEKIIWHNLTDSSTKELQFHLYANAFANNKTEMAKAHYFNESEMTKVKIISLLVDDAEYSFEYFQPDTDNPYDSTVAKINLDKQINPGDSVIIKINYELDVPRSTERFGYASGREFYFIAQWFPKLGVFENGEWVCSQYHPYTEFYSDFADYNVTITLPQNFIVGTTGELKRNQENDSTKSLTYITHNVIDFAWTASPEFEVAKRDYQSFTGNNIEVNFLLQPENTDLTERNFKAAFNTIEYLEKYIGEYPYPKITLVDAPRTSNLGGMEYPEIITYFTPLFTPIELQNPEATIIHEIIHQYFYAALSSNEVYEGWLDEGLATYLERKILLHYYGKSELYFRFIDYYPVSGLEFLSFNEIPLIYSLRELKVDQYSYSLYGYYLNDGLGSIMDTTYKLPTYRSTLTNVYSKPSLMLQSLDNYIGSDEILKLISKYYKSNKFSLVKSSDLLNEIRNFKKKDLSWFIHDFIYGNKKFDYKVDDIKQVDEKTYKIFLERLEEGIAPTQIAVYTEVDISYIDWNGEERWKEFTIESEQPVLAAEVDPHRQNLFDRNFANNSYTIETKYWGSLSIAIRWLFWIQNAMLVLGSVG